MSRKRGIPTYRLHRQSGLAIVTLADDLGGRRDVTLGKYNTPESKAEYARIIAEWESQGRRLAVPVGATKDLTITELVARFWPYAEQHYRYPDGRTTNELADFKYSLRPLVHFYGHTPAKEFGPLALKVVRQKMVDGYEHPRYGPQQALCRDVINQRVGRIRRLFKWGVEHELVPAPVLQGLQSVRGLQQGRSEARETEPVQPVPVEHVEAVLPFVRPPVAAMLRIQLLTGMRPGEVILLRGTDLDTSGPVWLYRPAVHKMAYKHCSRVVAIGPKAQEVLKPWLKEDPAAYVFSPHETMRALRKQQRQQRKTKVQPSQKNRRKRRPKCKPGDRYKTGSYNYAVVRACAKAGVPPFHVHQLRHNAGTEVRKAFGLDAARALLGHKSAKVTEEYAQIDVSKAVEVARQVG
jgi:integrase